MAKRLSTRTLYYCLLTFIITVTLTGCEKEPDPLPILTPYNSINIHTLLAHNANLLRLKTASDVPENTNIELLADNARLGVELAIRDYGTIRGYSIKLDPPHDSGCTTDNATEIANYISRQRHTFGVIGTTCSITAFSVASILNDAGIALISPTNTYPSLTSDLQGTPGTEHYPNYFRTASNDLRQAQEAAIFAYNRLGTRTAVVLNDGSPYSRAMDDAFRHTYESLDASASSLSIRPDQIDFDLLLPDVANADIVFMPLRPEDGLNFLIALNSIDRHYQQVFRDYQTTLEDLTDGISALGITPPERSKLMHKELPSYQLAYIAYAQAFDLYLTRLAQGENLTAPVPLEPDRFRTQENRHYQEHIEKYNAYRAEHGELPQLTVPIDVLDAYDDLYQTMTRRHAEAERYAAEQIASINEVRNAINQAYIESGGTGPLPQPLLAAADILAPEPVNERFLADPEQTVYALAYLVYSKVYFTYINAVHNREVYEGPTTETEREISINPIPGLTPRLNFQPLSNQPPDSPYAPAPA